MGRIVKWLFILALLGMVALVIYAFAGPFLGADFSAPQSETRQKVILDGK